MKENETTERYEYRTSNLMHNYYAVNSVDGMHKILLKKDCFKSYLKNIISKNSLMLSNTFNFTWNSLFTEHKLNILPQIIATPTYLIVNKAYIPKSLAYNSKPKKYQHQFCNTTHK